MKRIELEDDDKEKEKSNEWPVKEDEEGKSKTWKDETRFGETQESNSGGGK